MNRVDVFGKPEVELVHDLEDPTPIYISGERNQSFYSELGVDDADVVVVRDEEVLSGEDLDNHYEMCSYLDSETSVYIGQDAPYDFPGMKPQEAVALVEESAGSIVDQYLESDLHE